MPASFTTLYQDDLNRLVPEETQIITVNNRLARRVLSYFQKNLQAQRATAAIPEVLPLSAWFRRCEEELPLGETELPASFVLDAFSARQIWMHIIQAHSQGEQALIDVMQAAQLAHEADKLMDEWQISVDELLENDDYRSFMAWRQDYEDFLQAHELDDENRSIGRNIQALGSGQIQASKKNLVWVGFHEFSPRLKHLQHVVAQQNVQHFVLHWPQQPAQHIYRVAPETAEQEWRLAVQWAREQCAAHPTGRFAIVAVSLEQSAPFARRVLHEELDVAWNMALGRPLSEWPLVHQLLSWLNVFRLWREASGMPVVVPPQELGPALLSLQLGTLHGLHFGAVLDAHWRMEQVFSITFGTWEQALSAADSQFFQRWSQAWQYFEQAPRQAQVDEWAQHFKQLLQILGLPTVAGLDSTEYQVLQAFEQRLLQFARYGLALGALSYGQALKVFQQLCHEVLFQPEHDPQARVDVLGLLEAEGGQWDGVWVLGLTDEVFPAAPKPNPLIPYAALQQAGAPRATPEREYAWAQQSFEQLRHSAPQLWLSAPCFEDEEQLRPSPVITTFELVERPLFEAEIKPVPLESLVDNQAPPVDFDREQIRGGAALLDTQARNPLWAFVRYRLKARALPSYAQLSQAHLLGHFIHELLEKVWQQLPQPNQQGLSQWLAGDAAEQLEAWAQPAQARIFAGVPHSLANLVSEWAQEVCLEWLRFEAERTLNFDCAAAEMQQRWSHAGLSLNLRIDRLDRLSDGRWVLMDYKTGANVNLPTSNWQRARPIELQLPLYATLLQEQGQVIAGVALAHVAAGRVRFYGLGEEKLEEGFRDTQRMKYSWSELLNHWARHMKQLAEEFVQGHADNQIVDAKDLSYCDALAFLRVTAQGNYYD